MIEIKNLIYGIFTILLIVVIKKIFKWLKFCNTIDKIPGPKSHFFIGTMGEFQGLKREERFELQKKRFETYKGIYRDWVVGTPEIRLQRPEYVEKVITSTTNISKGQFYNLEFKKWLGNGLITSTGVTWHTHRKILTPAFHFSILEGFCEIFSEKCQIMIKKIEDNAVWRDEKPYSDVIDVYQYVNYCALDIICETAMGIQMKAQETGENEYLKAVAEMSVVASKRFLNPLYHYNWIFSLSSYGARSRKALASIHSFTDKVIKERQELRKSNISHENKENIDDVGRKRRKAFLDLLLDESEKNPSFTHKDIRDEVNTFMFAGHDTTTVAATFALYLIGLHPDVQERLYEEQKDIFGHSQEFPTLKTLREMKYMDRVIKESLRIFPPILSVSRTVTEEFKVNEYKIPKGANVSLNIYGCSRDTESFPEPEKFDPDRFLPEARNHHPYAFIPFSAGPRNCIGQKFAELEEKVILSMMIRHFEFTSVDSREKFKIVQELATRPVLGVRLKLKKR